MRKTAMALLCDKATRLGLEDHGFQSGKEQYLLMKNYSSNEKHYLQSVISLTRMCERWRKLIDRILLLVYGHGNMSKWDEHTKKYCILTEMDINRSAPKIKLALTTNQIALHSEELNINQAHEIQMRCSIRIIYNPLESKKVAITLSQESLLEEIKLSNQTPRIYNGLKKLVAIKDSVEAHNEKINRQQDTIKWEDIWTNPVRAAECYQMNRKCRTKLSEELESETYCLQDKLLFDILMSRNTATRFLCPYFEM